jgi:acyl-[acyl carrier protein]--UDP-N-acetylglucosamine O-acyltransferase
LPCKHVIGHGPELARALAAWRSVALSSAPAAALELRPLELDPAIGQAALTAALDGLDGLDGEGASAFVAFDARFLNGMRLDLMASLRLRGIAMPALVEPGALVAAGVRMDDNCWIGAGAIIQHGSRIGFNTVIGAGAIVGSGVTVGHSVWIDEGVVIGRGARIGAQVTLGLGVIVGHGRQIGKLCIVDKAGRIEHDIAARTFIHATHAQPIVIIGA